MSHEQIIELFNQNKSIREISEILSINRNVVHRVLKKLNLKRDRIESFRDSVKKGRVKCPVPKGSTRPLDVRNKISKSKITRKVEKRNFWNFLLDNIKKVGYPLARECDGLIQIQKPEVYISINDISEEPLILIKTSVNFYKTIEYVLLCIQYIEKIRRIEIYG